ncbi:YjgN family protein [Sphingomonas immobilis]|uniref:YjgN family protein n=1 Tax=Sphingomonas immobilis TaxID=3063997 RepID=A0ABT9A3S8_9SPHN|nr:YjgN family protein [Sphingomonas sp. CA1-15]MDO7844494.1 YjgN family protein [Sphingomonas sp. CA1-15]
MPYDSRDDKAFAFDGDWREFAPIALTNLLLCVVTLGVYLFWARTRERRYLWSRTRFIDDRLEWTGTGLELFIGYVFALVLFAIPFSLINFIALNGAMMRGHEGLAALIGFVMYLFLISLTGVAIFRALRYRLSRTLWHGIRGGSDAFGLAFGFSYLWKTVLGSFALGLLIPWSMTSLWNERWGRMSFGPHRFHAEARAGSIFLKFLLFYLAPIIAFFVIAILFAIFGVFAAMLGGFPQGGSEGGGAPPEGFMVILFAIGAAAYLLFFVVLGVVALVYYSAYFSEAVGKLTLGELQFAFTATTKDWIRLFLGNFLLVICTLGVGQVFVGYRNWTFFIRHMHAYGEMNLDTLTQSTTREPGQGEGLLDAFDIGAI